MLFVFFAILVNLMSVFIFGNVSDLEAEAATLPENSRRKARNTQNHVKFTMGLLPFVCFDRGERF